VLLGRVLHAKELDRAVGRGPDNRHEHDVGARVLRDVDQVGVAVAVHGGRRLALRPAEAVHGAEHDLNISQGG